MTDLRPARWAVWIALVAAGATLAGRLMRDGLDHLGFTIVATGAWLAFAAMLLTMRRRVERIRQKNRQA